MSVTKVHRQSENYIIIRIILYFFSKQIVLMFKLHTTTTVSRLEQ